MSVGEMLCRRKMSFPFQKSRAEFSKHRHVYTPTQVRVELLRAMFAKVVAIVAIVAVAAVAVVAAVCADVADGVWLAVESSALLEE